MRQSLPVSVAQVLQLLSRFYPRETATLLQFQTPFQLLVATILSAQSTDRQVNTITKELFQHFSNPIDFADLEPKELEPWIKGCGLHRNKSRHIISTSRALVKYHNSILPANFNDLMQLPGVGRKTANVVLSVAFHAPTMPVDTHVFRVAGRLGLASGNTPEKVERELLKIIPAEERGPFHHRVISHGRKICRARRPKCKECPLLEICPRNNL